MPVHSCYPFQTLAVRCDRTVVFGVYGRTVCRSYCRNHSRRRRLSLAAEDR